MTLRAMRGAVASQTAGCFAPSWTQELDLRPFKERF